MEDLLTRLDRVGVHQSVAARYCKEAAAEIRELRGLLQAALPHIACDTQGQNLLISAIGEKLEE